MPKSIEEIREAFETYIAAEWNGSLSARRIADDAKLWPGQYMDRVVQMMWLAWKAGFEAGERSCSKTKTTT